MPDYAQAHLLGLPLELREAIYDTLTADTKTLHLWDRNDALHLSAACTPPLALLQTHSQLNQEALAHCSRTRPITLHVDSDAFACLDDTALYFRAIQNCHYVRNTRVLELRPTLNASVDFLSQAMKLTMHVLLSPSVGIERVVVTWAESLTTPFQISWRPWAYKQAALMPLWDLVGKIELVCGGCVNAPPRTAVEENRKFTKFMEMLVAYVETEKNGTCDNENVGQNHAVRGGSCRFDNSL